MAARHRNNVRLGAQPRARQLTLELGRGFDLARVTAANRQRHERADREQLARCNRLLALEDAAKRPRFRRCPVCDGREDTSTPHQHGAAA